MSEETVKQSFTVSFHHGTDVALNHNRRTESLVEKESHIDPDGIHETWTDEPIGTAYRRIFGEALEEYNKKQKRKDRRIDDYLANVRGNSKLNDRYEFIAQVGNEKQHPDEPTAREILKEYHEDFIKRNGEHLEVIGSFYHADEVGGCPHLHEDYIPKAAGNKTGLKLRNNLTGALKALGFESYYIDDPDRGINEKTGKPYQKLVSAEMQFQAAERLRLAEICKAHGLEIVQPERRPEEYCSSEQLRRARDVRQQNQAKEQELETREQEAQIILDSVTAAQELATTVAADKLQLDQDKADFAQEKNEWDTSKDEAAKFLEQFGKEAAEPPKLEATPEALEETSPLKSLGTFKKEDAYTYAARKCKDVWGLFARKIYNPLRERFNKLLQVAKNLKRENSNLQNELNRYKAANKLLEDKTDAVVAERVAGKKETWQNEARAAALEQVKDKTNFYDRFFSNEKVAFRVSGQDYTLLSGAKSIHTLSLKYDDLQRITPYGLRQLAKILEGNEFKTVGEAVKYQEKKGFESVMDIPPETYNRSR